MAGRKPRAACGRDGRAARASTAEPEVLAHGGPAVDEDGVHSDRREPTADAPERPTVARLDDQRLNAHVALDDDLEREVDAIAAVGVAHAPALAGRAHVLTREGHRRQRGDGVVAPGAAL